VNIYLNHEMPQVELGRDGLTIFRGEPPPDSPAPVGCWRIIERGSIDPVDPDEILDVPPDKSLIGYRPPTGIYIVVSWTESDEEDFEPQSVYWVVRKGNTRIKFFRFGKTPKDVMTALEMLYEDSEQPAPCLEILV